MLPADRQAHTLSAGKIQQSQIGEHYDLMIGKWVTACLDIKNILLSSFLSLSFSCTLL